MFGFALKLASRLLLVALAGAAGFAFGLYRQLSEARQTWGVSPAEAERSLPGDELVPDAIVAETRGIDIDAPPETVWPWLVQMGYGRAGWYSYDRIDMDGRSADVILDDFQELAEGDRLPTHPGGGFEVRTLHPNEALVLYLDTELVNTADEAEDIPAGLLGAGFMGDMAMSEFRASWAFILEPASGGRTRLIERTRLWAADSGGPQRVALPLMGLGVFVMTRKQMLGLKERAERQTDSRED
ncbi:MAG: hypothetical protein AB1Z67_03765 [Candidatus Limnocylindrales bacterium]